jgi:hypothetical protein
MWIIATMAAGAYLGREHPVGVFLAFCVFMSLLALLIVNPALGAMTILLIAGIILFIVLLPFVIGYILGLAFIYFFIMGLARLVS